MTPSVNNTSEFFKGLGIPEKKYFSGTTQPFLL